MKSTDRRTTEHAAAVGRVAERMAEWMIHDNGDDLFTRFNLSRFAEGKLVREDMIIG